MALPAHEWQALISVYYGQKAETGHVNTLISKGILVRENRRLEVTQKGLDVLEERE
jgi:hypothetical protein